MFVIQNGTMICFFMVSESQMDINKTKFVNRVSGKDIEKKLKRKTQESTECDNGSVHTFS
jgi:hypothetical protein